MTHAKALYQLIHSKEEYHHELPISPVVSFDGETSFHVFVYPMISETITICLSVVGERESARSLDIDKFGGIRRNKQIKISRSTEASSLSALADNLIAEAAALIVLSGLQIHEFSK